MLFNSLVFRQNYGTVSIFGELDNSSPLKHLTVIQLAGPALVIVILTAIILLLENKKKLNYIFPAMLSVCMVFGVAPIQAGAEENDSEIAVQANDSAGKTEQQSTEEEECKHEGIEITFNSNGFGNCPKCNATVYQPAVETTDKYDIDDDSTKDTVYEISNAGQLYWFAGLVNGTLDGVEQNTLANAILTANITVNENLLDSLQYDTEGNVSNGSDFITWTPIADWMGNRTTQYSGTFDGNNKTVSGLYFNGDSTCIGLFGSSESDGNIKNVGVVDSYFKGNDHVGGVCGNNAGTITNCYNAGNLTAIESSATVGGICGYNNGGTVTNCYNTGTVTATGSVASVGGVCGCSIAPISNCYNIGTVTATSSSADISGICGYNYGPVKNCYYLADTEDENGGKTTAQFASGEVAYLLSQGCTVVVDKSDVTYDGSIWGQKLGENGDTYPVLDITKRVYQVDKYDGCEGKPGSSTKVYSNQSTSIYEEHSFAYEPVENGNAIKATCNECGATYTVKLTQPAATSDEKIVYDGTEKKAGTAIDSGNTGIETIPENAITYVCSNNNVSNVLIGTIIQIGRHFRFTPCSNMRYLRKSFQYFILTSLIGINHRRESHRYVFVPRLIQIMGQINDTLIGVTVHTMVCCHNQVHIFTIRHFLDIFP